MSLDLNAIRERNAKLNKIADGPLTGTSLAFGVALAANLSAADVPDLIAEVEQLRAAIERTVIVEIDSTDTDRLRRWLERPSGALTTDTDMGHLPRRGLTIEAVEGGGIWLKVTPR